MTKTRLPSFANPPVVETVLGVQFAPLPGFSAGYLGAFWKRLQSKAQPGETWCRLSDAPAINDTFETFEKDQRWRSGSLRVTLGQPPPIRLQVRNEQGDAMIQVQNGRIHYNWIGSPKAEYPRYSRVRPRFDRVLNEFCAFLKEEGLKAIEPNQWEVTYVNHIPRNSVWTEPAEWGTQVLNILQHSSFDPEIARLESLAGAWHLEIPPRRGRLHIDLKHAFTGDDDPAGEVLRLTLTARGEVKEDCSLGAGLDCGHEVIVLTFKNITGAQAHQFWGLRQ